MKKIIYICILCMMLPSCELLMEKPTTRLLDGSAFDTETALEAQITGLYGTLPSTFFSTNWVYYFNCSSQLVHWKSTRNGLLFEQCLRGTLYADQNTGRGLLTSMYSTIQKANTVLAGLESSPVDEAHKEKIEGEAYLIRGMMYFYLVRLFGDVPLHLKPVGSDQDAYVKRTSYLLVYEQIIEDLNNAFQMMPSAAEMPNINKLSGRPHKYAAKAFLAQVYLQIASMLYSPDDQAFGTLASGEVVPNFEFLDINSPEDAWSLALACADEVIGCGDYQLEPNYANLFNWDPTKANNSHFSKEKIFAIQMTPNGGSSTLSTYTLPAYMEGTQNGVTLTHASSPGLIRPCRYVFQRWAGKYGGEQRTEDSDVFYISCNDPRLDVSYIHGSYMQTAKDGERYETPQSIPVYPMVNDNDQSYFKKFFYPQFDQDAGYADLHLLRLAEMYYIAAEASMMLGRDGALGNSYAYVEKVHQRARGELDASAVQSSQPSWTAGSMSREEFLSELFWERVYEMGGECHEWMDSHRLGARWLLENVYEPLHEFLLENEQVEYKKTYWYGSRGYELPRTVDNVRNCLLCDYPKYELLYNQALSSDDQNFFNSSKAIFSVTADGTSNNESYDKENTLDW